MNHSFIAPVGVFIGESERAISKILDKNINLSVWNRGISQFLKGWLTLIKWEKVQPVEMDLDITNLQQFEDHLLNEVNNWVKSSPDFNNWFVSDVVEIASKFLQNTGAEKISLKLSPMKSGPTQLIAYQNHIKLFCAYAGPGVLWVPNKIKKSSDLNDVSISQCFQANQLDLVILKGECWPENNLGGAIYRFPQLLDDEKTILLELDFIKTLVSC